MQNKSVIIGNLTWNDARWRSTYINPKAGHAYVRKNPGHESLNFKFDKENLDTDEHIYGFLQYTKPPKEFKDGGIVIFASKAPNGNTSIVGIYCDVKIIEPPIKKPDDFFENGTYITNLRANKEFSMIFPERLDWNRSFFLREKNSIK